MEKLQISSVFVTLAVVLVCSRHGHVAAQDVASIVTKEIFDEIVAPASDCEGSGFYTYNEFIGAANAFEGFGTSSSDNVNRREIAAFFANTAHETGQFCYINEINQSNDYCDTTNTQYPCVEGKKYFGRGPIQLSWNFNYGPAGEYLNFDGLSNPEVVATDPAISYKTAVWYWMVQSECHTAITSGEGFGATINAINGAIECNGGNTDAVNSRVNYFRQYCDLFGVDPGSNLTC